MRKTIFLAAVVLAVLHQDFWFWGDPRLYLGFLSPGLAYHILYTIAASLFWAAAVHFAWPKDLERFAEGNDGTVPKEHVDA